MSAETRGDSTAGDSADAALASTSPAATDLSRGDSVGRYLVESVLGRGGMGVIYQARDLLLDRTVALKLLRQDRLHANALARKERLLKEAQSLAKVSHPNVATVHDFGTHVGQVFLAMEYFSGGTLTQWLERPHGWREAVDLFLQAGEGLAAAHERGLVHRDFKPDNVLLDARGVPHVTDFGLAIGDSEAEVSRAGTAGYMSPEQGFSGTVDARSDQFSFCVSLHQALYGTLPFPKDRKPGAALPLPPPAPDGTLVPAWVRRVVFKGLADDPQARFASMRELLAALRDDPAKKRRARRVTMASAAGLLALAGLTGWGLSRETPEERSRRECVERAEQRREELWSTHRRATMEEAFRTAPSGGNGKDIWERVNERLGGEIDRWVKASGALCAMPRGVLREQASACIEERRKVLQSMSDLFVAADERVVENALNTVLLEVQPVETCAPHKAIEPKKAASTAERDALWSNLARARVLRTAGKYSDAIVMAMNVAHVAEQRGLHLLEAEGQLLVGELYIELRRADADENLKLAMAAAERAGADEVRARAWIGLIASNSNRGREAEARDAERQADAVLERAGRPPLIEAARLLQVGQLDLRQGYADEARHNFETVLALRKKYLTDEHPLVTRALTHLANALPEEEQEPLLEKVLERQKKLFGSEHPETAQAIFNIGLSRLKFGRCAEALEPFQTALVLRAKTAQADPARLGLTHAVIAAALECDQKPLEALQHRTEAVDLYTQGGATDREMLEQLQVLHRLQTLLRRPVTEVRETKARIESLGGSVQDE